jgi:hypothetical protein
MRVVAAVSEAGGVEFVGRLLLYEGVDSAALDALFARV